MWNCPSGSTGAGPSVGGALTAPQISPSFSGMPSDYGMPICDGGNCSRVIPQQMMLAARSNMQMTYRCQQQFPNSQSMRPYSQPQMVQMQQRGVGVHPRDQQGFVNGSMYPGIPSATQRTPGMAPSMIPPQVRGMMMPGYNSGMAPSPCGQFLRTRQPGPMNAAYQTAYSQPNQSSFVSIELVRVGSAAMCSQLPSSVPQQSVGSYSNIDYRVAPDSFVPSVSYSACESKVAFCKEVIEYPIVLNHNSNSVEYIFIVPEEKFAQLQRGEIDVQLKGNIVSKNGDLMQHNVWPAASGRAKANGLSCVSVFLNSTKIEIMDLRRSLYLGSYCQKATNKLIITSTKCVCSHYFSLQYVQWKPVRQVVGEIFKRMKTDLATSKKKILNFIQMDINNSRIPLWWSKSQRINVPARSVHCKHAACFDLESFLTLNCESETFCCPLCRVRFTWNDFEIDQFVANILSECGGSSKFSEARIDPSTGCYQIIDLQTSVNCKQPQQRISMPCASNSGPVSQPVGNAAVSRSLKRMVNNEGTSSLGCQPSLKRIKSESFASSSGGCERQDMSLPSSSTFNPASVPVTSVSWVSSPAAPFSAASPCGFSSSPNTSQPGQQQQQQFNLSSVSAKYTAPSTPVTPGSGNNPASVGTSASPGNTQLQNAVPSQGSVEAVSASGSAPYTPASVSSLNSGNHCGVSNSSVPSINDTSSAGCSSAAGSGSIGEITCSLKTGSFQDVFGELIYADAKTSSASEMEMYLKDEAFNLASSKVLPSEGALSRSINDDEDWLDFAQVMANES
uniref:SP-RING-type domain-containing protein n=1 Tax=Syphacia muris TaxID=451379 RepID=A0A0N5AG19_9BILA